MSGQTYRLVGGPYDGQEVATYRDQPMLRVLCRRDRLYVGEYTPAANAAPRVLAYSEPTLTGGAA